MSKSPENTAPVVTAEVVTETPTEEAPVGRVRSFGRKVGTYVKEHKTATFAVVGLSALVAGAAVAGRATAPTPELSEETPEFDTQIDWDETPQDTDETVA